MPIHQTWRFYMESVVRQARRSRQSAEASSRQGIVGVPQRPAAPGHADEAVGLGYSGRTTPSRLNASSRADRAAVSAAQAAPSFPCPVRTILKHAHLRPNKSMEPTSVSVTAPLSRELLRTSRATGRKAPPPLRLARSVAHL